MIEITPTLHIPEDEISMTASSSSGPGGQNVNRVRTRVTLGFNVRTSPSLTPGQRERLLAGLAARLDSHGRLRVRSQKHRTQHQNRAEALERLKRLLADALDVPTPRLETRVPRSADARRLEEKRRRSRLKSERSRRPEPED